VLDAEIIGKLTLELRDLLPIEYRSLSMTRWIAAISSSPQVEAASSYLMLYPSYA